MTSIQKANAPPRGTADMWVVKDNALINASYNLELVEQRLILLAIIEARETGKGINANDALTIHASSYIQNFNVQKHTAYGALKDACRDLFSRQFSYQELSPKGNVINQTSRWVSQIGYIQEEGSVQLIFAPAVVPLITQLEQQFTSYDLEQVSTLKSKYATRLYEILISWRSVGKTPMIGLEELRGKLGLGVNDYKLLANFKLRVLEPAIKQINEHTDITVKVEQHKKGRSIIGFSFKFKQKQQSKIEKPIDQKRDPKTVDMFTGKTDAETKNIARAVVKDTSPPANPLLHRASRITTSIITHKLHERFKHGDEGLSSTLKRIQGEIMEGGEETADYWQSKLEDFGINFD